MDNNQVDSRTSRFREEYQGKRFFTKDEKIEFEIVDARAYGDVDIQFIDSGLIKNTKISNIKRGMTNPFYNSAVRSGTGYAPVCFDTFQHQHNGCIYRTNEGSTLQITNYVSDREVYYRFLDQYAAEGCTTMQNIKKGQVKNPFARNTYGGYNGMLTDYNSNEYDWLHHIWHSLIYRSNSQGVKLEPAWLCYNSFAVWYLGETSKLNPKYEYSLDKDVLYPYYAQFTNGRKVCSRYSCVIIPKDLSVCIPRSDMATNTVSKKKKEEMRQNLDKLSKFYFNEGAITSDIYCTIRRFYVEDPQYRNYVSERFADMCNLQTF